jgi:hypothetical protein
MAKKATLIATDNLVDEIEAMVRAKVAAEEEKQAKMIIKV